MSSNIRINRICQFCNNEFVEKTTVTKFCGDPCAKRAYKARKRNEKIAFSKEETKQTIQQPIIQIQAKEFLTVAEASQILNLSRTTIWRLIKKEQLKAAKLGSRIIIHKSDISQLLN
jgi:excisionase family DNA binding protein